jgi:N-acetyl-gamma-glutamyl-phosphate reductase
MQLAVDEHANRLVVSIAIDNLGKGAAGQAIQNANLMCGFPEDSGLSQLATK